MVIEDITSCSHWPAIAVWITWPRSCVQVLLTDPGLSPAGVCVVACLPAISEEILFRGAVVGGCGHSGLAVIATGLFFGLLHVSGGRSYASGVFASFAGCLYGVVYVLQASVASAAVAHAVGNLSSASLWLLQRGDVQVLQGVDEADKDHSQKAHSQDEI
jgi:membrane protease YdiL (CAAX protease family)